MTTALTGVLAESSACAAEALHHAQTTRRTQAERSAATIKKLLIASVQVLIDGGYYRASTQEICNQAGLSQGALFRHFPTRLALMVATAEYIAEQLLEQFILRFQRDEPDLPPDLIRMTLQLLRANSRAPLQLAWYELLVASRTDRELREALLPIWQKKMSQIQTHAAKLLPELHARIPYFEASVDVVMLFFQGEAINNMINPSAQGDERRVEWLSRLFHAQLGTHNEPLVAMPPASLRED